MGCCARTSDNAIIKSSNIPLLYQESLDKKENSLQNNSNIFTNIVSPQQKIKSDKISFLKTQKGKSKAEKKYLKSMNVLKNLSIIEVNESAKYFS